MKKKPLILALVLAAAAVAGFLAYGTHTPGALVGGWADSANPRWVRFFDRDGSYQEVGQGTEQVSGKWSVRGDQLTIEPEGQHPIVAGWRVSLNGRTLYLQLEPEGLGKVTQVLNRLGKSIPKEATPAP